MPKSIRGIPHRGNIVEPDFKPAPTEIKIDPDKYTHLWNAFEHSETEASAYYLLRMAYRRGNWAPFTKADVEAVYGAQDGYTFNRLIDPGIGYGLPGERYESGGGWIVKKDGLYYFTEEFIDRCYLSVGGDKLRKQIDQKYPWEREHRTI
jgi:hypothetical protein